MLTNGLRRRLDRVFVKVTGSGAGGADTGAPLALPAAGASSGHDHHRKSAPQFRIASMQMVGTEPIAGQQYTKHVRGKATQLPVLPSDHYGLLVAIEETGAM
jgi:hypothetical protein